MSVAGILASSLFANTAARAVNHNNSQPPSFGVQFANTFQSYLKSGNASGAQSMFETMQQKLAAFGSNTSPVSAQMSQLGQDLKSGDTSAAQSDFNGIQSTLQQGLAARLHHVNPAPGSGSSSANSTTTGDALLSNPMTAALQAYSSLQNTANTSLLANSSSFSVKV